MSDLNEQNADDIQESSAAKTAYHLAVIPILGLFFYAGLAFLALYQIGSQGRSGLFLLSKGFWRMCRMTLVGLVGAAAIWFCPERATETDISYDSLLPSPVRFERRYSNIPNNVRKYFSILDNCSGFGLVLRDLSWPPKRVKIGQWYFYDNRFELIKKSRYWFGKENGEVILYPGTWSESRYQMVDGKCNGTFIWRYTSYDPTDLHSHLIPSLPYISCRVEAICKDDTMNGVVSFLIDDIKRAEMDIYQGHFIGYDPEINYGMYEIEISDKLMKDDLSEGFAGKNGKYQEWDKKQKLIISGNYKNDIRHGLWKVWYSSGQQSSEENYVEGKLDGKVSYWYDNGQKREEGEYNNGKPVKQWKHWNEKGALVLEESYDENGKILNANKH
jgi:hypothetical protein